MWNIKGVDSSYCTDVRMCLTLPHGRHIKLSFQNISKYVDVHLRPISDIKSSLYSTLHHDHV